MRIERSRDTERDIAYLIHALDIVGDIWCEKYGENCYECPLGSLGVLVTQTCYEVYKLKKPFGVSL